MAVNGKIPQKLLKNDSVGLLELQAAIAGSGLAGGAGSALSVNVGVGVEINTDAIRLAAQGAGIAGGAGSTLSLQTDTGTFAPTFTGAGSWSFSTNRLQVTGTPDSANDAVNKSYVDSVAAGLQWKAPIDSKNYLGNRTIVEMNALTPVLGDTIVSTDAGTPTSGTSDALVAGSVAEYDGTQWKEIVAGSGGFVASGVKLHIHDTGTLFAPLTDATDETKIATFDGTSLTGTFTAPTDGDARLVIGASSVFANRGLVFDTTSAGWVQFTGANSTNAGAGLSASGNVFNIGDVNRGVQVNADDLEIDASEIAHADGALEASANSWQLKIKPAATADGAAVTVATAGLSVDGDIINIDYAQTNYTPAITGTGADIDDLAAHLEGIDNALGAISGAGTPRQHALATEVITASDTAMAAQLTNTPVSSASVKLHYFGILLEQGATKDYTVAAKVVTWLASSGTAPDQATSELLIATYESSD